MFVLLPGERVAEAEAGAEELQPATTQVLPVRPAVAQDLDAAELSTLCHPLQRLRALLDAHTLEPAQAALCRAEYLTSLRVRPDLHVTTKLAALGYLAAEGTSPWVCDLVPCSHTASRTQPAEEALLAHRPNSGCVHLLCTARRAWSIPPRTRGMLRCNPAPRL